MWATINYHKTTIFVIIAILLSVMWLTVPEEEVDDPFTITVDYDCREIVRDPSDIPKDIVEQCRELVRKLEMKDAPKERKRSLTA
jgi:hypothetical protein